MFKDKVNYKLLNILIIVAIIYLGLITMDYWFGAVTKIIDIIFPFLIAFAIAYALHPFVVKLKNKGVRPKLAVTFVVVSITAIMAILVVVTIPLIYEQLITLSKMVGDVITDLSSRFAVNLGGFEESINSVLNAIISNLGGFISNGTVSIIDKSVNFFTKFIIIYVVSIYFLADMENIRFKTKLFLKRKSERAFNYVRQLDNGMESYLKGLIIFIAVQFVEYSFLFWIVGHPNWLLLGFLASITTVIPYFGGLITNIIAVILASVISSKLFILTLIICLVFPNVDGYFISPKIYGKTSNVNPLMSIFAVFAGGALLGFVGILISLPVYILLKTTYQFFEEDIYDKIEDIKVEKKNKSKE